MPAAAEAPLKEPKGEGCSGIMTRFWDYLIFLFVGLKWNLIEIFTRHKKLNMQKIPRRQGDVAIITGGARGIGVEVIKKLLILDMHVVIGCRDEQAGKSMVEQIRKDGINAGAAHTIGLDLTSLESVREFAGKVLKKYRRINILINNAGIMLTPYQLTKDGLEAQFQVNYLSHFLLTNLLLPRLKSTGTPEKPSRIVNVSSVAYYGGKLNFEDLQMTSPHARYMASKMMQVVSTNDLEKRLKSEGANVHVYAVHPGVVKTDLYKHVWWANTFSCLTRIIFKNAKQGSDCVTFAAVSSKVADKGGLFFANCKKEKLTNEVKSVEVQRKLWNISCELTGITNVTANAVSQVNVVNEKEEESSRNAIGIIDSEKNQKDDDSMIPYDTRSTDTGSVEGVITVHTHDPTNEAESIVAAVEKNIEDEIVTISVDFVNEIVEKSEEIANEQMNAYEEGFLPDEVEEQVNQQGSSTNDLETHGKVKMESVSSSGGDDSINSKTVQEEDDNESTTKVYGEVSITEIVDEPEVAVRPNRPYLSSLKRLTPNITITIASEPGSDGDADSVRSLVIDDVTIVAADADTDATNANATAAATTAATTSTPADATDAATTTTN